MLHRRSRTLGGSSDRAVATKSGTRGSNGAATDLLVCFPSRAHLALMPPKAICSPSRSRPSSASEPVKRRHSTSRPGPPSGLYYKSATARNPPSHRRRRGADDGAPVDDEPTSPKVTCAGQIKARPPKPKGPGGGKKTNKKATWLQALGIKKDAMALLDALHGAFRLNVAGCFGSFPGAVGVAGYTSGEDDDEEEGDDDAPRAEKETEHGAALARWFMVLEEGKKKVSTKKLRGQEPEQSQEEDAAPPANALMLMRCRSAPAKGLAWRLEAEEEREDVKSATRKAPEKEKAKEKEKESLVLMTYSPDFFKVSLDIAKETWIVGGDDAVLRCRSWKR